ncbi:hypothetical protein [Sporosarcina psychrophila]|uniref:hypothetical protein n=1 Tax=Sporosarcina psychrophila TaxID=1476 RepID=UPI00078CD21C|nr:hypothetical protein [Sporosarcina psychrophila]AMQ06750.1 hypothetical protein AZE41_12850 [Sporosarcina psychrophila]
MSNDVNNKNDVIDKEGGKLKERYIKIYHLYYLLGIAAIIIILLVSFIFKSSSYAGSMLAFAATLSSVLLAVIAIIITLIDVSGQKQNVFDMKKEVERLAEIIDKSSDFSKELDAGLSQIEKNHQENAKMLTSLYGLVQESKQEDNPEQFYEKAKELLNRNLEGNMYNVKNTKEFKTAYKEVLNYITIHPGSNPNDILSYFKKNRPGDYIVFYREAINNIIFNKDATIDNQGGLNINF